VDNNNKGALDLSNNQSVSGRYRYVDVCYYFLHELKEEEIILTKWVSSKENFTDTFTKNLGGSPFEKHLEFLW